MSKWELIQQFIDYTDHQLLRHLLQEYRETLGESQDVQGAEQNRSERGQRQEAHLPDAQVVGAGSSRGCQMTEYRVIYQFDRETGQVMAAVPELNYVSSFGADFAEAEQNIMEAVAAYLETLLAEGQLLPRSVREREGTFLRVPDVEAVMAGSRA